MKSIQISTDGACRGNPGPGAWAAILEYGDTQKEMSGFNRETTNNQMELCAVIEALKQLKEPCEIKLYTDSKYVKNGITLWLSKWELNGWKTAQRKPVKNQELWKTLKLLSNKHHITWHWVRGHSGHPQNERCDALANQRIDEHLKRSH